MRDLLFMDKAWINLVYRCFQPSIFHFTEPSQIRCAICTLGRPGRDSRQSVRALFRRESSWRGFLLPLYLVHSFDKKKNGKDNNQETDDGSVANRRAAYQSGTSRSVV